MSPETVKANEPYRITKQAEASAAEEEGVFGLWELMVSAVGPEATNFLTPVGTAFDDRFAAVPKSLQQLSRYAATYANAGRAGQKARRKRKHRQ